MQWKQLSKNMETKIKAVLVVHLYGLSPRRIWIKSWRFVIINVPVIEDAAESLGTYYKGQHTGTFEYGIFSFNGNKIITTSGGDAGQQRRKVKSSLLVNAIP